MVVKVLEQETGADLVSSSRVDHIGVAVIVLARQRYQNAPMKTPDCVRVLSRRALGYATFRDVNAP
jgi:hypothetical protein